MQRLVEIIEGRSEATGSAGEADRVESDPVEPDPVEPEAAAEADEDTEPEAN